MPERPSFVVRPEDPAMLAELDAAAAKRGLSRNAFVVKALRRVLEGEGHPAPRSAPAPKPDPGHTETGRQVTPRPKR